MRKTSVFLLAWLLRRRSQVKSQRKNEAETGELEEFVCKIGIYTGGVCATRVQLLYFPVSTAGIIVGAQHSFLLLLDAPLIQRSSVQSDLHTNCQICSRAG